MKKIIITIVIVLFLLINSCSNNIEEFVNPLDGKFKKTETVEYIEIQHSEQRYNSQFSDEEIINRVTYIQNILSEGSGEEYLTVISDHYTSYLNRKYTKDELELQLNIMRDRKYRDLDGSNLNIEIVQLTRTAKYNRHLVKIKIGEITYENEYLEMNGNIFLNEIIKN